MCNSRSSWNKPLPHSWVTATLRMTVNFCSVHEQAHDKNARLEVQRTLNISEAERLLPCFPSCSACPPLTKRLTVLFFLVLAYKFSKSPSYRSVIVGPYVQVRQSCSGSSEGPGCKQPLTGITRICSCALQPGESPMKSPLLWFSLGRKGVCSVLANSFPSWITSVKPNFLWFLFVILTDDRIPQSLEIPLFCWWRLLTHSSSCFSQIKVFV